MRVESGIAPREKSRRRVVRGREGGGGDEGDRRAPVTCTRATTVPDADLVVGVGDTGNSSSKSGGGLHERQVDGWMLRGLLGA